ncbi:LOW QUALITY PROTEIN: protein DETOXIFICATION 46, chloroplastic [Arabidopsis lyrata subsp. lyrata]|uniref:LOW QUALITY PROTEIN: protein DETOXIFICATION 46, chloroplastic n=1 Tax=Arabidopsis lyrata subsp. lyrata TaxID=81972 RepID=UPI000A29DB37|nr:LOW QUALITY PROTEIN: protein DETOXIFICATION 46, chloroplastic [Arabidopsis lyrata subsp. lyrata]|eukprot:XP_002878546.2 LOW QUALITY PROTEIN: protein DETOXIFICATION 46, chloroplastic [Arabidopsis lyrata subsp. lyrata]
MQNPNFYSFFDSFNPKLPPLPSSITLRSWNPPLPSFRSSSVSGAKLNRFLRNCASPNQELVADEETGNGLISEEANGSISPEVEEVKVDDLANQNIWGQMKEIVMFTGPAAGLWLCGPLMSLIDTAVIGQGSSLELAALGPATVICDYLCYTFMFLSVATSNLVATSLARRDKDEVQHQISILLFIGLACGVTMMVFTRLFGSWALTAFTGVKNAEIVPAANTYVQIRGLAWPAVLIGWVAQSASLGMKDSWGPLKALAVASAINGVGDVVLCTFLGYGIAGAAWATMVSQVVAAYMMMDALNKKGYSAFSFCVPSPSELLTIFGLAAPVFITMMSKVLFYTLLVYFATSMGTSIIAAHQVMLQIYGMSTVWGEPLSQTAQSFMPELLFGINRNLPKARMLLKSLVIIGASLGIVVGTIGTAVPWLFPGIFTQDKVVTSEMHKVIIPYFLALSITPITHSLEGTLLAGRDLRYISLSMTGCLAVAGLLLMLLSNGGFGLRGCWYALVGFQWARFSLSLFRLLSRDGVLYSEDTSRYTEKVKAA